MYTWTNGEVITAQKLNNINNIMIVEPDQDGNLDVTWDEINNCISNGGMAYLHKKNHERGGINIIPLKTIVPKEESDVNAYLVIFDNEDDGGAWTSSSSTDTLMTT